MLMDFWTIIQLHGMFRCVRRALIRRSWLPLHLNHHYCDSQRFPLVLPICIPCISLLCAQYSTESMHNGTLDGRGLLAGLSIVGVSEPWALQSLGWPARWRTEAFEALYEGASQHKIAGALADTVL